MDRTSSSLDVSECLGGDTVTVSFHGKDAPQIKANDSWAMTGWKEIATGASRQHPFDKLGQKIQETRSAGRGTRLRLALRSTRGRSYVPCLFQQTLKFWSKSSNYIPAGAGRRGAGLGRQVERHLCGCEGEDGFESLTGHLLH